MDTVLLVIQHTMVHFHLAKGCPTINALLKQLHYPTQQMRSLTPASQPGNNYNYEIWFRRLEVPCNRHPGRPQVAVVVFLMLTTVLVPISCSGTRHLQLFA